MITIVSIIVFGVLFSIFATNNTQTIDMSLGSYKITDIQLYLVVLIAIGIGVVIAGIYYLIHWLSVSMTMGEKDKEIKDYRKEINMLTKEVHKLELENTKLKSKLDEEDFDEESI